MKALLPTRAPQSRRRRASKRSGFTLVELLVAMVAGLMVVMAVIALGRDATNAFQDEARTAGAEMSVRLAKERLRYDLERAGFMSTANIAIDTSITRIIGDAVQLGAPTAPGYVVEPGLQKLASIRLNTGFSRTGVGGDGTDNVFTYSTNNLVNPDGIEISGNMTTGDEFTAYVDQSPASVGACASRLWLNTQDPAVLRIMVDPATNALRPIPDMMAILMSYFHPVPATTGFAVRVSNFQGNAYQYAPVGIGCDGQPNGLGAGAVGWDVASGRLYVSLQRALIDTSQAPQSGITPGMGASSLVTINPVQTVRWRIRRLTQATLESNTGLNSLKGARFELVRQFIPPSVGPFAALPAACTVGGNDVCTEIVSEFPVDLKFGFSVADPTTPGSITTFDMDSAAATNQAWAPATAFNLNDTQGPHLIRGITFRMAIRASVPDRRVNLGAPPNYLYRYCTDTTPLATCANFSRVRTTVEDVYLVNQANGWESGRGGPY